MKETDQAKIDEPDANTFMMHVLPTTSSLYFLLVQAVVDADETRYQRVGLTIVTAGISRPRQKIDRFRRDGEDRESDESLICLN